MPMIVSHARLIDVDRDRPMARCVEDAWFEVDDGRIAEVGTGAPPSYRDATTLDVDGAFVAPGFVSAHSHLFTSGVRGLGVESTLYGWCDAMLGFLAAASPEAYYWSTLHGSLDFLANGTTTAFDFTDPRIPWEPMVAGAKSGVGALRPFAHQAAQIDAKADSGLRFVNAASLDDAIGAPEEVLERFGRVVVHVATKDPRFALAAAIMGAVQWSPRPDAAELEVAAMRRFGVVNQAHFLETREEVDLQRSKFARYAAAGALGPDMIFGHFIQTTPEIIAAAAAGGAAMSWQPASNGRLASGVIDLPGIRSSGMRVGVGLDDQACTDVADPWQNMRMGIAMVRAQTGDPRSILPEEILRDATIGSAEVIDVAERVGSLEVGKEADFLVVDPRRPDIGPLWSPVRNYVLSCGQRNLKAVYVGGELVSRDGVSTNPLAAEASAQIHRLLPELAATHPPLG